MSKSPPLPTLPLAERPPGVSVAAWLDRALRSALDAGRVAPGARLPATRALARQLGLARGTVEAAYLRLADEGRVTARVGDGTRVQLQPPRPPPAASVAPAEEISPARPARLARRADAWRATPFPLANTPPRAFRANQPSTRDFPLALWTRLTSRRLHLATHALLIERDPLGYLPLREAIAAHLRETRGLPCTGAQVLIVSGMQMTLDLCARTLLDPGDQAWVEDPGYPGAARLLPASGVRPVSVPVDTQGLRVADGERRAPRARLAVVTAGHQFPLGVALAPARRAALLRWAMARDAWILEDDYDSEFRFAGRPSLALQAMVGGERVLFAGSFNKMLFPSLRLGFLVLPPALVEPMRAIRSLTDRFPAAIEQAVLADFIGEGHFERHLRRMRVRYAERQEALLAAAAREWGPRLAVARTETGLQTTGWLSDGRDAEDVAAAALARGIELVPLTRCAHTPPARALRWLGHPPRTGLQIGFGAMTPSELRAGVSEVAAVLDAMA